MRWLVVSVTAAVAEILAYGLSLAWGFMILLLAFIVTALMAIPSAAKIRTTEQRVNAIIPTLASHQAQINTAQGTANNAQSTANNANNAANNAQNTANNAVQNGTDPTFSALTVSGACTVQGNFNPNGGIPGNLSVGGNIVSGGNINSGGGSIYASGTNINTIYIGHAHGSLSLGTSGSGSPDGNTGSAWGTGERTYINGLWAAVAGLNNYLN